MQEEGKILHIKELLVTSRKQGGTPKEAQGSERVSVSTKQIKKRLPIVQFNPSPPDLTQSSIYRE